MFKITALPVFNDNYIWVLQYANYAIIVDPGQAQAVLSYLAQHDLTLAGILVTHQHMDHIGGIAELLTHFTVPVYGPADISLVTHPVKDNKNFFLPKMPYQAQVFAVPGHTLNHVAYYIENYLFCGDTLFACGCGRLFEGTADMMYSSLQRLASLPDDTQVCCAHEYTLANEAFASAVEPNNKALRQRMQDDQALRQQGIPTLPSTMGLEKATNPFLRARDLAAFTALRQAKDTF
jgi:hydroxyacylglutathione hydrolase